MLLQYPSKEEVERIIREVRKLRFVKVIYNHSKCPKWCSSSKCRLTFTLLRFEIIVVRMKYPSFHSLYFLINQSDEGHTKWRVEYFILTEILNRNEPHFSGRQLHFRPDRHDSYGYCNRILRFHLPFHILENSRCECSPDWKNRTKLS